MSILPKNNKVTQVTFGSLEMIYGALDLSFAPLTSISFGSLHTLDRVYLSTPGHGYVCNNQLTNFSFPATWIFY